MTERVPVGVAVIITDYADRILLMQRQGKHGAGTWAVPGGWVDLGEGPVNACRREAMKEVGLTLFGVDFLGYTHDIFPEGIEDICLWFHCDSFTGTPYIVEPEKCTQLRWKTLDEFEALPPELVFGGHDRMNIRLLLGR